MDPRDCVNLFLRGDLYFCKNCSLNVGRQVGELAEIFSYRVENPTNRVVRSRILCDSFDCMEPTCTRYRLQKALKSPGFLEINGKIPEEDMILRPNVLTVGVNRDVPMCRRLLTQRRTE